jgi:enamine deaminase RidA (YjgF/YER057c/UK114 family)
VTTPHRIVNPPELPAPAGFSHAVAAAPGTTVHLGGQAGHDAEGRIVDGGLVAQFDRAAANVVTALAAAGGRPEDLVSMQIYVTDAAVYRAVAKEIGVAYRSHFGRHYPAAALFEVPALFDPAALVELVCTAVIPD